MSPFVLDASVALAWVFDDEFNDYSRFVFSMMEDGTAIVPIVWPLEVANGLLTAVKRGRLRVTDPPRLFGDLSRLRIAVDRGVSPEALGPAALAIGQTYQLSAYDASYVELAVRRGIPLATQDKHLYEAAIVAGVTLLRQ